MGRVVDIYDEILLPTQADVFACTDRTICEIAGVGTGKTQTAAMISARESRKYNNNLGIVAAKSAPQLKMSTIPKCLEYWDSRKIWYDYSEYKSIVKFANGSWFKFQSLDVNPGELKGSELGWLVVDEVDVCEQAHIESLFQRVRRKGTSRQKFLFGNSPPPNHWLEKWFKPVEPGVAPRGTLFQATTYENCFLPTDYIKDTLERMYPPGSPQHDRFMLGKLGIALEGAIYPEYNTRDHHCEERQVPTGDAAIGFLYGLDFGYHHPTVFLEVVIGEDDVMYVVREYAKSQGLLAEHAAKIRSMYRGGPIFSDHDSQDRAELEHYGINTVLADKDVGLGIDNVRYRLRNKKLKIVAKNCPLLCSEFPKYVWDRDTEKPKKINDDALDALRYIVNGFDGAPSMDSRLLAALRANAYEGDQNA